MTSKKKKLIILTILTVLLLIFIWGNSVLPAAPSRSLSKWLTRLLRTGQLGTAIRKSTGILTEAKVRKLMHATEFTSLGILLSLYSRTLERKKLRHFGFCLLCGLFAASLDEFIQTFNNRTASIKDIGIDFGGFLFGTLLVWGVSLLIHGISNRIHKGKKQV